MDISHNEGMLHLYKWFEEGTSLFLHHCVPGALGHSIMVPDVLIRSLNEEGIVLTGNEEEWRFRGAFTFDGARWTYVESGGTAIYELAWSQFHPKGTPCVVIKWATLGWLFLNPEAQTTEDEAVAP